jgi:hypothetical protein
MLRSVMMPQRTFMVRMLSPATGAVSMHYSLGALLMRDSGHGRVFHRSGIKLAKSLPVLVNLLHNKNWLVSSLPSPRIPSRGVFFGQMNFTQPA